MIHEILPVGKLQCNCSVFGDESTREALVIDPGDEIESILEVVRRHGLAVKAIVITHAHIDHIGGAARMKEATGAPVYMNLNDEGLFRTPEDLRSKIASSVGDVPADRIVCYCGSGVTACHNLLAFEHAGLKGARLFAGSWSEWSSDPSRPIEKG